MAENAFTPEWLRGHNAKLKAPVKLTTEAKETSAFRPRKYRNEPVFLGSERFDSKKEATVFQHLTMRQAASEISELQRQVEFPLYACERSTGILNVISVYVCDFQYLEAGQKIVVDVKSSATRKIRMYQLKKAWLAVQEGIVITEI